MQRYLASRAQLFIYECPADGQNPIKCWEYGPPINGEDCTPAPHRQDYSHVDARQVANWLSGHDEPLQYAVGAVELPGYEHCRTDPQRPALPEFYRCVREMQRRRDRGEGRAIHPIRD